MLNGTKRTEDYRKEETPYYAPVQQRTARCYFWNPQGQAARHTSVYVPVGWGGAGHTEIPTDKMPSV